MAQDPIPESDFSLIRKFFAVEETISLQIAERTYSNSKLQAAQTADPKTFSQWLTAAKAWRAKTKFFTH